MFSHDEGRLWAYASRELDGAEVSVTEDHLADCPECRERLDFIRATRLVVRVATQADAPRVQWGSVDAAIQRAVARRLVPAFAWGRWAFGAFAAVGVIAAIVYASPLPRGEGQCEGATSPLVTS